MTSHVECWGGEFPGATAEISGLAWLLDQFDTGDGVDLDEVKRELEAMRYRSGAGLYGDSAFVPSREEVRQDPAAMAAREAAFAADRIPLAAEDRKLPAPAPPVVVMGALHPRQETPAPPARPAPEREETTSMRKNTPKQEERVERLRELLAAKGPLTSAEVRDALEYYEGNDTMLRSDAAQAGATKASRFAPWTLPAGEQAARVVEAPVSALPIDVKALGDEQLLQLVEAATEEKKRRATELRQRAERLEAA